MQPVSPRCLAGVESAILRHSLDQAIDSSVNAIAFADLEARLTHVNGAFLRMWGYEEASQVVGRHASAFGVAEEALGILTKTAARGGWTSQTHATNSIGERFPIEVSVSVVEDAAGTPIGIMVSTAPLPLLPPQPGSETVLLVEDEPAVLRLGKNVLERLGYVVLTASTPGEALELFTARPEEVDVLVTDVVMPEMSGMDLATRLRALRPDLKALFLSGYPASAFTLRGVLAPGVHFLQKPFSVDDLAARVRDVLDDVR